ncbi:MAG: hypothetical protein ACYC4T_13990, partial [Melioribacteraceae bacterium]
MKRNSVLLLPLYAFLILAFSSLRAKEIIVSADKIQVNIVVGTTSKLKGVAFDILIKNAIPENDTIDREKFAMERENLPRFEIRDADDKIAFELERSKIIAMLFYIQMFDDKPEIIEALSNQQNYIFIDSPIKIALKSGDYLIISPEVLKTATLAKVFLSEENKQRLIAARGGAHTLYQNKIDFGVRGDEVDENKKAFIFNFSYFGTPASSVPWWVFATKGYLSTNKNDPLSEIHIFPLTIGQIFGLDKGKPFETGEIRCFIGIEGNQTFRKSRLNGSFYYTTM